MKFALKIDSDIQARYTSDDLRNMLCQVTNSINMKCAHDLSKKAHGKIVDNNCNVVGYWEFDPCDGELDENL